MRALISEYAQKLPTDVVKAAQSSLTETADTQVYAESIAQFFERAVTISSCPNVEQRP